MTLRENPPLSKDEARRQSPLKLAYIGDTVFDLLTRMRMMDRGYNLHNMHQSAVRIVNAKAQAEALQRILPALTGEEADVARRGKNAHAHHAAPRNQEAIDYHAASGLEALFGYLYLTGQEERLIDLFRLSQEEEACPQQK